MSASSSDTPVWFITGCSTGFGRELAAAVIEKGWRAVVAARNPDSVADLVARAADRAIAVRLDVTRADEIQSAVAQAHEAFGRIDVLVNNAGFGYLAAVEEGEDDEVRAMFEANFFGAAAMIRAVLPRMRERRSGHIVNITSVGGLVGNPGSGYYAATKFALEGLGEALARETETLGIKVTAVEPGPFRTDWAGRSLKQTRHSIDDYAEGAGTRRAAIAERSGRQPGDPARAAQVIIEAVTAAEPPGHLVLGGPGLELVRGKLARLTAEIDTWHERSAWTDNPS
ncbi:MULTISPECIES: oxidoreductase [unclassified Caballeronia]|uniref:oxidoreductase n=1 Tax=unclassified Caballeronia TaxID=2646786 RepID=UPI0028629B38|nr:MULTISPECIES: oxidoreductase [unclassified Caballeronia]MDR5823929.1 oxidoreductase [Caballeronia sp. LZ043]MDR5881825.1 oxidoreductase [Caballeronia sp. LZ032]